MYFELPKYGAGPTRYRYILVNITSQNFHRNRRDDSMLTVANHELVSAVRDEYACYGPVNIFLPDSLIYDTCESACPVMFLNIYKWDSAFSDGVVPVLFTDDELVALLRMRYPKHAKNPDVVRTALEKYHAETNGTVMYIKIDDPHPELIDLFQNGHKDT